MVDSDEKSKPCRYRKMLLAPSLWRVEKAGAMAHQLGFASGFQRERRLSECRKMGRDTLADLTVLGNGDYLWPVDVVLKVVSGSMRSRQGPEE